MFVSAGLWYKSMLSAAIHYATLNSFRSIKLPSSLYKPPVLMLAPPRPLSRGILLQGRRHGVLCRIYWAIAKWTAGVKGMHELVIFSILCIGSGQVTWDWPSYIFFPLKFLCTVTHIIVDHMLAASDLILYYWNFKKCTRSVHISKSGEWPNSVMGDIIKA